MRVLEVDKWSGRDSPKKIWSDYRVVWDIFHLEDQFSVRLSYRVSFNVIKNPLKQKIIKQFFSHQAKPQQKESNWLRPQWFGGGSRCQKPIYKPEATFDDTGTYCVIARYGKALVSFL